MSKEICKSSKVKRSVLQRVSLGLLAFVLLCGAACRGGEEQGIGATPTKTGGMDGFYGADSELVQARAREFAATTVVTVGDTELAMDKAMFFIYSMELRGNYYAMYYEAQYGTDYWEMPYDEAGRTVREAFKDQTMDTMIQYAVLYQCAAENGISLTAEELAQNNAYVEQIKERLTAEETERGGFTTEVLRNVCEWMMVAEKYYDKMTEGLGVTREDISGSINREEYREYETEYIYLATTYYDENYELQQESEERKAAYAQQMADFYEEVQGGVSFEELAEGEEALLHETRTFLVNGSGAEKAYAEAAVKLSAGEISEPVQTEYGIYLIKMVDDNCTGSYEAAVDAAYEAARSEAFDAAYQVLLSKYPVEINEETWNEVLLGAMVSIME